MSRLTPARRASSATDISASGRAATSFLESDDASSLSGDNFVVDAACAATGYPDLRPFLG